MEAMFEHIRVGGLGFRGGSGGLGRGGWGGYLSTNIPCIGRHTYYTCSKNLHMMWIGREQKIMWCK